MLGPLDVSLREVHRLPMFLVLCSEGLHPFYQLVPLLGGLSYPLQMYNANDEL